MKCPQLLNFLSIFGYFRLVGKLIKSLALINCFDLRIEKLSKGFDENIECT